MDKFFNSLTNVIELLNTNCSANEILEYIYHSFKEFIPYDRISIVLLDYYKKVYSFALYSDDESDLKVGFASDLSRTSLSKVITEKKHRIIRNYKDYLKTNPASDPTKILVSEGYMSSIAYPLIANNIGIGALIFSSKEPDAYSEKHVRYVQLLAINIAISIEKNEFVDDLILASITGFCKLVEAKDSETGLHIERMQNYSKVIAKKLSEKEKYKKIVTGQYIKNIFKFSPLHDIGKVGIADGILLKPGRLTHEEFEVIKRHTIIGAEVLKKSSNNLLRKNRQFFNMGIEITLCHHERFDGKGYPYGISGEEIPISARIVIVADVLDALTSRRVYKQAYDIENSLQMVSEESGKMFDPDVIESLRNSKPEIMKIYNNFKEELDWRL